MTPPPAPASAVDFGTVPAWVSALGSLLAFALALWIYFKALQEKRAEQARLVSAFIEERQSVDLGGTTIVKLRNVQVPWTLINITINR